MECLVFFFGYCKKSDSDSGNDLANGLGNGQSLGHLGKRKRIYRPKDSLMT